MRREAVKELKMTGCEGRTPASVCVCVWAEHVFLRRRVCVWVCVAAALGHLHASALSGCQELWGHRQGSGEGTLEEASEPPPTHTPTYPPTMPPRFLPPSTTPNPLPTTTFFPSPPRYPPSSRPPPPPPPPPPRLPLVVTGWVGHSGGEGAQGGKVPLWLTAGRSGFRRHGSGGKGHMHTLMQTHQGVGKNVNINQVDDWFRSVLLKHLRLVNVHHTRKRNSTMWFQTINSKY